MGPTYTIIKIWTGHGEEFLMLNNLNTTDPIAEVIAYTKVHNWKVLSLQIMTNKAILI